jgi:hypothetical protein
LIVPNPSCGDRVPQHTHQRSTGPAVPDALWTVRGMLETLIHDAEHVAE